ncbi:DUF6241 domain-containing protein [Lysinibacillus sp. M3]|uniref:DUF6241 domain-containing protein n=1 Tax=Lysinibacillus zambalensis TaxID=3160866 RepID=A0ABV1MQ70_9BACI
MKRKTKSVISIIVILIIFGGAFSYFKFTEQVEKPTPEEEKVKAVVVGNDGEILESKTKAELLYPDNLVESQVSEAIHSMSHQKVQSGAQWGREQITQEKIERLLIVCKMNDYKYNEIYISILERWSKGDFSKAVEDHNAVWEIHGGDEEAPGKASRLSTPEEEMYYIKEYFTDKPDNQDESNNSSQQ